MELVYVISTCDIFSYGPLNLDRRNDIANILVDYFPTHRLQMTLAKMLGLMKFSFSKGARPHEIFL